MNIIIAVIAFTVVGMMGTQVGIDESKINNDIFFKDFINGPKEDGTGNYEPLALATQVISGVKENFIGDRFSLDDCYPNPADDFTSIQFKINNTNLVEINLKDSQGRTLKNILYEERTEGTHVIRINTIDLPAGIYFYQMKTGFFHETKKLIIAR